MPVYLELVDMEKSFHESTHQKIIINDLPNKSKQDREQFNYLIKEVHSDEIISLMPRCKCGALQGEHLVGNFCDECKSPVMKSIDDEIKSILWFRSPAGVSKLLLPQMWIMLSNRFQKRGFSTLQWLTDRTYSPMNKNLKIIEKLNYDAVPRGYNSFVEHFDDIYNYLLSTKEFTTKNLIHRMFMDTVGLPENEDPLSFMIRHNRDKIFSQYIPIPNKILVIIEKNSLGRFVEKNVFGIHNALNTMLSIDRDYHDKKVTNLENRTARILSMLSNYYLDYVAKNIRPKPALCRKHVYGTRGNYTFRAVITSHDSPADHDEVHIGWCTAVGTFWQHIMSILLKPNHPLGGMTHIEATEYLIEHVYKYDKRLDDIFKMFIANSPGGAIKTLFQRNPTLMAGSAQNLRITKVKTDPQDQTTSLSEMICGAPNADFDGDETFFTIATDEYMQQMFYPFSPFFNLLLMDKPLAISKNASMVDSIIESTSEWLASE